MIAESGGWHFAQDLTNTLRYVKPEAVQIAEYWDNDPGNRWKGIAAPPYGMGFDIGFELIPIAIVVAIWATVTRCETPCAT